MHEGNGVRLEMASLYPSICIRGIDTASHWLCTFHCTAHVNRKDVGQMTSQCKGMMDRFRSKPRYWSKYAERSGLKSVWNAQRACRRTVGFAASVQLREGVVTRIECISSTVQLAPYVGNPISHW